MPYREDGNRLAVLDLEQGNVARMAEGDEQFPQEGAGLGTLGLAAGKGNHSRSSMA